MYISEFVLPPRLWAKTPPDPPMLHEAANRVFDSIAELEAVLGPRCVEISELSELVRSHTIFHWRPTTDHVEHR